MPINISEEVTSFKISVFVCCHYITGTIKLCIFGWGCLVFWALHKNSSLSCDTWGKLIAHLWFEAWEENKQKKKKKTKLQNTTTVLFLFSKMHWKPHFCYSVWVSRGDFNYQWMYVLAVLAGCTYCLHAYLEWMQTPLNLWGPLYNNWGTVSSNEYCKARWPECLEMCTISF